MVSLHAVFVAFFISNSCPEVIATDVSTFVAVRPCDLSFKRSRRWTVSPSLRRDDRGEHRSEDQRNKKRKNDAKQSTSSRNHRNVEKKKEIDLMLQSMGLQPVSIHEKHGNFRKTNEFNDVTSSSDVSANRRKKMTRRSPSSSQLKQHSPTTTSETKSKHSKLSSSLHNVVASIDLTTQLSYARNGHAVLRSFLDAQLLPQLRIDLEQYAAQHQIDAWRQKVEVQSGSLELAQSFNTIPECQQVLRKYLPHDPDQQSLPFLQYFNTWKSLSKIRQFLTHSPRLAHAASVLMDCPEVRLYQDSLFCKYAGDDQPGGGPTPWHVDARMAPFDTSNMITFWIPLQRTTHTGLVFCSKSHSDFSLPFWNEFDSPAWYDLERRYPPDSSIVDYMPLAVGDVTVHSGWTLHCSDPANIEEGNCRMALSITYVDAMAPVRPNAAVFPTSQKSRTESTSQLGGGGYADMEDFWSYREWIDQVPHGEPFEHDLVPIVWP